MNNAASFVKKCVEPVIGILDKIGMVVFLLLVGMLLYSVIARYLSHFSLLNISPLKGAIELSELGMGLVIFSFLAGNYFKADQMTMDTFVEKVPSKGRHIIGAFVHLTNFVILGLMTWQLFVYGLTLQDSGQTSVNLQIPIFPFVYFAAICSVVLTGVYFGHFLNSLVDVCNAWRK